MSFNYKKSGDQHSNDSFWTSYSDLFLGLSCIFLLLYVVSSMRQGADSIKQQVVNEQLAQENNDLKNQLKAYEDIKNQYMKDQASVEEKTEYNELVDKLSLLQEENQSENDKLKKQLLENSKKEASLNKYQQMVRNMLNANKLAKTKINTREVVIEEKSQVIEVKEGQITDLEKEVQQNKQLIAKGERDITEAKEQLDVRLHELRSAYKNNKITRAILEKKMAQANSESKNKVQALQAEKQKYQEELTGVTQKLNAVASNLDETKGLLEKKTGEAEMLQNKVSQTAAEGNAKIANLKAGFAAQQAREKAAFEGELGKMKLGAAERERREGAFRAAAADKERAMNDKIGGLQGELGRAKAELEARQMVAKDIAKSFANAGIKAEVNNETGEVLLDFGESYFDSGSAQLKNEMKHVIEKAVPIYAKSLLGNAKISEKVSAVEIIGFASPTYKGRFVDPKSGAKEDKEALKYNMDLSYSRAKSIFNYMIDNQKDKNPYNKSLMALMKVSGRSFLEAANVKTNVSPESFCKVNDCKKAQRVVIRFSMDKK
jgi:outer membrane protein OmpA-like peptidoglycan-associated protein